LYRLFLQVDFTMLASALAELASMSPLACGGYHWAVSQATPRRNGSHRHGQACKGGEANDPQTYENFTVEILLDDKQARRTEWCIQVRCRYVGWLKPTTD
jgi:hypothetical protein